MAGNSLNLVDLVKSYLPGDLGNRMSSLLGESRDKTQTATDASIAGTLAAFANTASSSDGARRLTSAVDDADDSILSNVGGLLGKSSDSGINALRSILGGGGLSEL